MPKYCKGKCGRKISCQNKTGYCKECFGRFILSSKGANASKRDTSKKKLALNLQHAICCSKHQFSRYWNSILICEKMLLFSDIHAISGQKQLRDLDFCFVL